MKMKAHLLFPDRDMDLNLPPPPNATALLQDLDLETLVKAMADGDDFIETVVSKVLSVRPNDIQTVFYRQSVLRDCLENPHIIRHLYQLTVEAAETKRKRWLGVFSRSPSGVLSGALTMMELFIELVKKLSLVAETSTHLFLSDGFQNLFQMILTELDEEYVSSMEKYVSRLRFRDGILISSNLGMGNEPDGYVLRSYEAPSFSWFLKLFSRKSSVCNFYIHPRDDANNRALSDLRDNGLSLVASILAQSAAHIDDFFKMLRTELAFYVGCINLSEQLQQKGSPIVIPMVASAETCDLVFRGMYDVCLALSVEKPVVGNDLDAIGKNLFIITGANQGGKSTFLRSIGLAQLMLECGMFVGAEEYSGYLSAGIFTHYRRKEDRTMKSGKLDEELSRMNQMVPQLSANAIVLFNESFGATNEREGSEIARQITDALLEKQIKVFFVSHQYTFAQGYYVQNLHNAIFLRAERSSKGKRSFRIVTGEPKQTSHGADIYQEVFFGTEQS